MTRRIAVLLILATAAVAVSACGNKPQVRTEGETEGTYLNVGPLVYQVQISRQLNPGDLEDRTYLEGIPPAERGLRKGETWFGVFIQVLNETKQAHPTAANFSIEDTQDNVATPISQSPTNPFTYQPRVLPAMNVIPYPNSVAGEGVIQGVLVLFKVPLTNLDNRPLEFVVRDALDNSGRVKLDV